MRIDWDNIAINAIILVFVLGYVALFVMPFTGGVR
jgi:hypothetical protein